MWWWTWWQAWWAAWNQPRPPARLRLYVTERDGSRRAVCLERVRVQR